MPASERQPNRPVTEAATLTERAAMTSTADAAASDITRRPPMRSRTTIKAKFINALMPDIWELPGTLTR